LPVLAVHADWSIAPAKRWMTVASPTAEGWHVAAPKPVGAPQTLLARLRSEAGASAVALGLDCPLGLPREYAALHVLAPNFPAFLRGLGESSAFFTVAATLAESGAASPFYPARGFAGMTRLSHAQALGMTAAAGLSRACDRATAARPAGAPLFWTLGANQTGKAAISAWRDMLIPALRGVPPPRLWPFEGNFLSLLQPGRVAIAETYPAEAMRQLAIRPRGSKRRQTDRAAYAPALLAAMPSLSAVPAPDLIEAAYAGFGQDVAGEDRFDSLLGVLNVLGVLLGRRPDGAPDDPAIRTWEGWVLGQTDAPILPAA
jgi:hypothetical protein